MSEPREYTVDEIREQFLADIWRKVDYWEQLPNKTKRERLSGLVHSVLAALDGCALSVPGFLLIPNPHPSDKEFHEARGENWYPSPSLENDIGGDLHGLWYKVRKE